MVQQRGRVCFGLGSQPWRKDWRTGAKLSRRGKKMGDGRGGALTGRRMDCQREINKEREAGSRWPAAGLPRRDSDRLTSGLPLAGATHRSPTSVLSHLTRGLEWITYMINYREAEIRLASRHFLNEMHHGWPRRWSELEHRFVLWKSLDTTNYYIYKQLSKSKLSKHN